MKTKILLFSSLLLLLHTGPAWAWGLDPKPLTTLAVSDNPRAASNAVAQLRRLGPEGFAALLKTHAPLLAQHNDQDPQWLRLRAALDVVGGQKDCHVSRLFWHTNFADAQAEAQQSGKPILSLRLLGNLDTDLSCANSRFFRTTLYANAEVSQYLREHFVLHWKSVRPVPRITIDMGDGRKIERTITGNSIHYVLDANGAVVDALPGLYGPRAFLAGLKEAEVMAQRVAKSEAVTRGRLLENFHLARLNESNRRWAADLRQVLPPETLAPKTVALTNGLMMVQAHPAAAAAMPLALSKSGVERPMLRAMLPMRDSLERTMNDETWAKLAALHRDDAVLDASSVALIRAKNPTAGEAGRRAGTKLFVEDPLLRTMINLQRSIAEDTVRNEYTFHARIHEWLATANASREVEALNRRVYAELFLTPDSDPWLGLVPANTFSALENGGLVDR